MNALARRLTAPALRLGLVAALHAAAIAALVGLAVRQPAAPGPDRVFEMRLIESVPPPAAVPAVVPPLTAPPPRRVAEASPRQKAVAQFEPQQILAAPETAPTPGAAVLPEPAPAPAAAAPVAAAAPPAQAPLAPPRFDADYLNNPAPAYPLAAKRRGEEGKVVLRVQVGPDGRAGDVVIAASSGFPLLDEAALAAVRGWRFVPARRGEAAVAASVLVPLRFKLDG
jgi:protein TonB